MRRLREVQLIKAATLSGYTLSEARMLCLHRWSELKPLPYYQDVHRNLKDILKRVNKCVVYFPRITPLELSCDGQYDGDVIGRGATWSTWFYDDRDIFPDVRQSHYHSSLGGLSTVLRSDKKLDI